MAETLQVKFVDSKGRTWYPKASTRNIADLETRRGIAFWPLAIELGNALQTLSPQATVEEQVKVLMTYSNKLFGSITDTARFVHDCCADLWQRVIIDGEAVTLDSLIDAINGENITDMMICSALCIVGYFPKPGNKTSGCESHPFAKENCRCSLAGMMSTH
jgi:hypothetical protein